MDNIITWGWSGLSHDAALAVFVGEKLVYASHSERYSRVKNDPYLNQGIIDEALKYGYPNEIYFYESILLPTGPVYTVLKEGKMEGKGDKVGRGSSTQDKEEDGRIGK